MIFSVGLIGILGVFWVPSSQAASTGTILDKEKLRAQVTQVVVECKEKSGASIVDIEAIRSRKLPNTHAGLCMLECFFDSAKVMEDGKFKREGMVSAFTPLLKGDSTGLNRVKQLAEVCDKEVGNGDKDKCRTAKMVVECVTKHGKKYGIQIPPSTTV